MKKQIWIPILIAILIVVGAILIATQKQETKQNKEPIKIGFIGPLTGDAAVAGIEEKNAVKIATKEINQNGGINGRKLEIIYEDGKCNGQDSVIAGEKLINVNKVKIILGGCCSSETLALSPVVEKNKTILLSAWSTSPDITNAGDYVFRIVPSDTDPDVIGPLLPYLKQNKSIALISENTNFSMGVRQILKKKISDIIIADELFSPNEKDFRSYLTKIKNQKPQALFINVGSSATNAGLIAKQATELGLDVKFYGNFNLVGADSLEIATGSLEGAVAFDVPLLNENNLKAKVFMENYLNEFGEPYNFWDAGASYDRIFIITNALKQCNEDADCIKDFLYNMDWYNGVIGKYKFDKNGDVVGIKGAVKKIVNGQVEVIK